MTPLRGTVVDAEKRPPLVCVGEGGRHQRTGRCHIFIVTKGHFTSSSARRAT